MGLPRFLPDEWAVALQYRIRMGYWPDLRYPSTFGEKLCALKLHADGRALGKYVDKIEARAVAARALGGDCLVPLIGVWERAQDVPVLDLPACALKCTHASHAGLRIAGALGDAWSLRGGRQVCALSEVPRVLDRWMKRDWYYVARERPYHYVTPRIMAEKWIDGAADYKVMVFKGRARAIQWHGMEGDRATIDLYDEYGFSLNAGKQGFGRQGKRRIDFYLAARLSLAAEQVAGEIAPAQDYVRVDFLVAPDGKQYFGEITFYDSGGLRAFEPASVDYEFGRWLR